MSTFQELGIAAPILQAIDEMGFVTPTEVQAQAIPHILGGKDLIVMSKTGSGKTAVFGVSMLQMTDPAAPGPLGLVLTPTRELAVQVESDLKLLGKHLEHKTTAVFGQHSMNTEVTVLKRGVTIVTGTPGRVFDHIRHGTLVTKNIKFLVLDEADRMLDMGFIDQVERIIRSIPKNRITLLFSATIPPEIRRVCLEYMKDPDTIEIASPTKTVDTIEQLYYRVPHNEKRTQLNRLLLVEQPESCMIFCNTRIGVDQVQNFLTRKGYASQALHGDIPQSRRLKTIEQFKQGEFHILVATDVAARGIHIEGLSLVINYDVPVEKDSYVHRIGRTGRAGLTGRAISIVSSDDIMSLYAIEEHINSMIAEEELPSDEVFNERKAAAGKWLEANALKIQPGQEEESAETRTGTREGARSREGAGRRHSDNRKRQADRTGQAGGHTGSRSDSRNADRKKSTHTAHTKQVTEKEGQAPYKSQARPPRPPRPPKPEQTASGEAPIQQQIAQQSRKEGTGTVRPHPAPPREGQRVIRFDPNRSSAAASSVASGNSQNGPRTQSKPAASVDTGKQPLFKRLISRITGK